TLICGPALWSAVKSDPTLAALPAGNVTIVVPVLGADGKPSRNQRMEGKLFQSDKEIVAFWKAFTAQGDFTDLKVRKLTTEELRLFWAMISFDITEPLFVVEGPKQKILVAFTSPDHM